MSSINSLLPAMKLGQDNVFTGVCDSVHMGGSASVHAGIPTHPEQAAPREQAPCRRKASWEIRSTRGRYASYWNANFFFSMLLQVRHS